MDPPAAEGRKGDCARGHAAKFTLIGQICCMAPRTFVNKIDNVTIYTSPKCSCRSVSDFAWAVSNAKAMRCDTRINIIVFRNPFRRLIQRLPEPGNGLKHIDTIHFSSQIEKYKRIPFDIVSDSENLEPLGNYINRLFFTAETMPFRVNEYGPKTAKEAPPSPGEESPSEQPWRLEADTLLGRIRAKQTPAYEAFFNEQLKGQVRRFYEEDFDFLQACLDKGVIGPDVHTLMTRI
jgi:hypothetical protein